MLQDLYRGAAANDKTGTPARTGGQIINDNFKYLDNKITRKDGIVVSTGSSISGQDVTYNAFWQWIIDTIDYTNPVDVVINFPLATTGYSRLDLVALTTSNTPIRIAGTESDSNPISPALPDNMIQAGFVLVTDSSVGEPSPPIVGNNYVEKLESSEWFVSGGNMDILFGLPNSSLRFIGTKTIVEGIYVWPEYKAYSGKKLILKNFQSVDIIIKHLAYNGANNHNFYFPNEVDFVLKPGQIIEFSLSLNIKRFEFIGIIPNVSGLKYEELAYACSDETTNLTVGTLITFRMPFAMTLTSVKISVNTAPTVSTIVVDVKESGISIFSTPLSIDATEKTSVTASTPAVISDVNLANDAELTVMTTQIGSGVAGTGLKITFIGTRV
jgi:hypothetical protein